MLLLLLSVSSMMNSCGLFLWRVHSLKRSLVRIPEGPPLDCMGLPNESTNLDKIRQIEVHDLTTVFFSYSRHVKENDNKNAQNNNYQIGSQSPGQQKSITIYLLYKTAVYILCVEMLGNAHCRRLAKQEKPFEKMSNCKWTLCDICTGEQ